jgi:hypothetical protein
MNEQPHHEDQDPAEDLLRRALLDGESAAAAVAMKVDGLSLCDELTIIFHGRRDLSTIQTYVAHGGRSAGTAVGASELLRVPCDLDLADAADRDGAEQLYVEQARALRDALLAADTVLSVWCEPLADVAGSRINIDRSIELGVVFPAHRLMPVALVAPECRLMVAPVCGVRTLAEGRPPLGIVCAQQDVAHVYPLFDDPERCLDDFLTRAADHARRLNERLAHQEASVERFLELSDE